MPIKDDFQKLIREFPRLSNEYKQGTVTDDKKIIKEGESIYSSKAFKWSFFFMLGGFLILLIGKIINPESGSTWSAIGVIGGGVFFYGIMILEKRKNN